MSVLWLDEIGDGDGPRVGAKALSLARLRRQGLPVPDGFVLTAGTPVDGAGRDALVAAYGRLGGAVAVRSSSTAEDLAGASFAGQYKTVLDVRGEEAVAAAADVCLRSAGDAAGYARAVAAAGGTMAVLVQRFVEPRAAGVAFTRHPQDATALLIESHAGRGEALVSGTLTPDRYVLDRASGILRGGRPGGSLDPDALAAVAVLARRAEELLGAPQDVEWAVAAEGPVLLQARPITVEAEEEPDPRLRRLTRANVGEVLPGPVTPLTWTTLGAFLEHAFRAVSAVTGLMPGDPPPFLVLHRQRLYLNLSLCADVAARLPGVSADHAEQLILGGGGASGLSRGFDLRALPVLVGVGVRLLRLAARLPRDIEACEERVRRLPSRATIDAAEAPALARLLEAFADVGRALATTHVATSGASAFQLALLGRVVAAVAPGDPAALVNRLVAGLDDVESASPATALEALAGDAAARPEWTAWLARASADADRALRLDEPPPELARRLREFLGRFGHRALSEGELRADTWQDDPTPVLTALRTLATAPRAAGFRRRARSEARRADEEALLARLGPVRQAVAVRALDAAQRWVRERERTKSAAVAMIDHGRRLARAAARRLVAAGVLRREDDVYFLTLAELIAALDERAAPVARLERRRRRHEREGALPAPREVNLLAREENEAGPSSGALRGIGVSAGVGIGTAHVLRPGEAPRLEPGEVLVAPVLDAAHGPLLVSAAAAVAEIGGMLSHGAVVARELGVPCVVDVRDATRRIHTGDRVFVDGGSGQVRCWPEGATGADESGPQAVLAPADAADEAFHSLEDHPRARESVYFNIQDPNAGVAIVASVGVKRGEGGEALLALALPDGRILFGLELEPARHSDRCVAVGPASVGWDPVRLRFAGALSSHEPRDFPPAPIPLLLSPRTVPVVVDLEFVPTTPAIDFCAALPTDTLEALAPLGRHHVEQSGLFRGELRVDGRRIPVEGTGSRDHSWGRRDWDAADHWRLFTVRFGDDLALHALSVSVEGRLVEGGFVWRGGRAEAVTRVEYAVERDGERLRSLELAVASAAGPPLHLRGRVHRTLTVPVQADGRLLRHLAGRPYALVLHENYTCYEAEGRIGHGMAEFTQRAR